MTRRTGNNYSGARWAHARRRPRPSGPTLRLLRLAAGDYATADGRYRIERGWADAPGWTIAEYAADAVLILDTFPRLRDAREHLTAIYAKEQS